MVLPGPYFPVSNESGSTSLSPSLKAKAVRPGLKTKEVTDLVFSYGSEIDYMPVGVEW